MISRGARKKWKHLEPRIFVPTKCVGLINSDGVRYLKDLASYWKAVSGGATQELVEIQDILDRLGSK